MFIIIWMLLKCVVVEILTYHASWNMTKLQFSLIIYVITWSPSGTRTLSDSVTSVQVPRDSNYSRTIVEGNKHRESWSFLLWITSHNHSYSTAGAHMQTYIHTHIRTHTVDNKSYHSICIIYFILHTLTAETAWPAVPYGKVPGQNMDLVRTCAQTHTDRQKGEDISD